MLKAVIIDDEPDAINALKTIITEYCKDLAVVVGTATNGLQGVKEVLSKNPDVVFLDVQMSGGTGFDFLESFPSIDFQVVFVTAYEKYALRAIKHKTVDYLLKPVDIDELIGTLQHITRITDAGKANATSIKISVTNNKISIYIDSEDLLYCKADGSYVSLYMKDGQVHTVSKQLKHYEEQLLGFGFLRSHHSYLVNVNHILNINKKDGLEIELRNGTKLPISIRKKDAILNAIKSI